MRVKAVTSCQTIKPDKLKATDLSGQADVNYLKAQVHIHESLVCGREKSHYHMKSDDLQ